jgi:trigger factor
VKVTQEKIEGRQAYLTVEMEQPEVEAGLSKAYNRLVQKYNIPGFRKGKTPRPILEQYIGKPALLEDAVEKMAPEVYEKAVKEKELKPVARPRIELEKTDPVIYKMVVPLEPVVKLGDYHQVRATPEPVEVKEEDVDKAIDQLRHQHSLWEPVERQVNSRDLVTLDIESHIGEQPYINQKDAEFEVDKESEFPMKGFSEQLIGLKKGETKEFKLSFPQDYNRAELAGKETSFKVSIKEIKEEKLPALDDDFSKQVKSDFKTMEDLRKNVKDNLQKTSEENAKTAFQQKVIDAVVTMSEVEYPPIVEDEELDTMIRQQMQRWQVDENGLDSYLQSIQKTAEQFKEELRPMAVRSLKQSLVLTELALQENIKIESSDIEKEVEAMTKDLAGERKDKLVELLKTPQIQANIASTIVTRRTVEKLTEIAQSPAENTEKKETAEAQSTEAAPKEVKE